MKKKVLFVCLIGVLLITGAFTGCASTGGSSLYSDLMLPSIAKEEHAVLIVDPFISITSVNGQFVFNFTHDKNAEVIPLPAGTYEMEVWYYKEESKNLNNGYWSTETTQTEKPTLIKYDFAPGRYYSLTADVGGNTIAYKITEETDTAQAKIIVAQEQISKAKVKEPTPWSIGYVKKDPTKFEGTWKTDDGKFELSFTGNTYVWSLNGMLRGNFSFADDTVMFYPTGLYGANGWMGMPNKLTQKFKYTLSGNILTVDKYILKKQIK